jgi:ABC-type glycerol-3-phosphate transport system permease component
MPTQRILGMSRRTAFYSLLIVCVLANLFPFYWMTVTSL